MKRSLYTLFTVLLVNIMYASEVNAANWKALEITPSIETYYDTESLSGPSNKKQITIGQDIIGVVQDGVRSRQMGYEIDCIQKTSLFKSMTNYDAPGGGGVGTPVTIQANPPWPIKPKSLAELFFNVACPNNVAEQPAKTTVVTQEKKEVITPNLSIVTRFPEFPDRPEPGAYEMLNAKGSSPSTDDINLQIYSDGHAAFVSNGRIKFLKHTGNGIFVDQDTKLIVDQKNSQLSINGLIVKSIQFVEKAPPAPKDYSIDSAKEPSAICAAYHNFWYLMAYKSKAGNDMMFSDRVQKNIDAQYRSDKEYDDIKSKMFSQLATINMGNPSQSQIDYVKSAAAFCVKVGQPIGQMTGR